jgi:hypothetical protein
MPILCLSVHNLMELLELLHLPLTWRDGPGWQRAAELLTAWLEEDRTIAGILRRHSGLVHTGIAAIDPFIEQMTMVVCPICLDVCCRWENCRYDVIDLVYLLTMGAASPVFTEGLPEQGPCLYLASSGCTIERTNRPFRCTWHFCPALVTHMAQMPQKPVRSFSVRFQEIQAIRQETMSLLMGSISQHAEVQNLLELPHRGASDKTDQPPFHQL